MRSMNPESNMGRLAREIEEVSFADQEVDIGYLHHKLGSEFTRKQISDWTSHLRKRGYLEKLGIGRYKATQQLHLTMGRDLNETLDQSRTTERIIVRKKRPKKAPAAEEMHQVDLTHFINLVNRFGDSLNKLEDIISRFHDQAELQKAVDVMKNSLAQQKT